jgi:hypothetical protein
MFIGKEKDFTSQKQRQQGAHRALTNLLNKFTFIK